MFLSYKCHYQICSDDGDESSSRKKRSISALLHIYTHTRFDVNVTENKEANHCHHHQLASPSLVIVVVRCLANCIDINLMVATRRHSGINYHTCARLLSTLLCMRIYIYMRQETKRQRQKTRRRRRRRRRKAGCSDCSNEIDDSSTETINNLCIFESC
jgi:hypothetical protein